ncbi:uncharacterized protein LOC115877717 [Sitophilus oryzae]|uniref:Uncharacterized protein LOC115877717 n=1 Tax=Sitophilus oryzae TaxID=7048 RepID=A0A6J2XF17_SITOR|nr:uncharacterized protein LOC115877717 [Sitophilus oryzae]
MAQQRNTSKISKTPSGATRLTTTSTFSEMQADPGASQKGGGSCSACSAARRGGSQISGSRHTTTSSSRRPEASGSARNTSGGPYPGSGQAGARIRYAMDSGSTSSIPRQGRQGSRIPQRAISKGAPCNVCGSKGGQPRDTMTPEMAQQQFEMASAGVAKVETPVTHDLLQRALRDDGKVYARGQDISEVQQQMIVTPAGLEPVLQQTYTEQRIERDEMAEKVIKNLAVAEMDECSGKGVRVIISEQQLDPGFGLSHEGKDIVTVKETISVTPSYTSTAKDVTHEAIRPKIDVDPYEVARLVEEESEDVENTLKIAPPDLMLTEEKYAMKKRLQQLRLNSETMALIEESVINPVATADEALVETAPEALVQIMYTVESGVTPECAPDQMFHTLFEEKPTEQSVVLSSVSPGPLQDVLIPQQFVLDLHKEPLSGELNKLTDIYKNVTDADDWPHVDVFHTAMDDEAKHPKKDIPSRSFKPIADEDVPWGDEDLEPLVNIVGAEPETVLEPSNAKELEESGNLETELSHGIEYFVEADPIQYMSRVQLRGSHAPPWFPGYIYALPEFPELIKVAKNPDEVFMASWKACQPKLMPDESLSMSM